MTLIQKPDYVEGLANVNHISTILRPLSIQLQANRFNPMESLCMIESMKNVLEDARKFGFQEVYSHAEKVTEQLHAEFSLQTGG